MSESSSPVNPGTEGTDAPRLDTLFMLLSDSHRRRLLTELAEDTPRSVETLVDTAARENPRSPEIELYHNHLPKLQEAGVIEWEMDTGTIRRGPQFDTVAAIVGVLRSNQDALPADWP